MDVKNDEGSEESLTTLEDQQTTTSGYASLRMAGSTLEETKSSPLVKTTGRRKIFRSLSETRINENGFMQNRQYSDTELTTEEINSITANENLMKQLEIISRRFEPMDPSVQSQAESQSESEDDELNLLRKRTNLALSGSSSQIDSTEELISEAHDSNPLLILNPDHPLMKRFQTMYKKHLQKHNEKLTLEMKESKETLKQVTKVHEDIGEELYNAQQGLAKSQAQLELCHKEWHSFCEERKAMQEQLLVSRDQHQETSQAVLELEKRTTDLRSELSRWDLLNHLMDKLKEDMKTDVGALRRAAEKVEGSLADLEDEKHRQDIAIKKKMEEAIRMEEALEMFKKHHTAQDEELVKARLNMAESQMRIECVEVEKRHVFQQWKHTLSQLEQKDEAIKTLYESLTGLLNESFTRSANINNLKKVIDKEMELHETLLMAKSRTGRLIDRTESEIEKMENKMETSQRILSLQMNILQETENSLRESAKELHEIKREDDMNIKKLDIIVSQRCELEDQLSEKYLEYISSEKAIVYSERLTTKLGKSVQHMEGTVVHLENEVAQLMMQLTSTAIRCQKLEEELEVNNKEVEEQTELVKGLENLISRNNLNISNKQAAMNQLIIRLDQYLQEAGGDMSPLETKIRTLERHIENKAGEMQMLKVNWLHRQTELVFLTHERDQLSAVCIQSGRQFNIYNDKKRRLEDGIEDQKKDIHQTEMSFKTLQSTISKLSGNIYSEKGQHANLMSVTTVAETTMIRTWKDAELQSIQYQAKLDLQKSEKSQLENELLEARQQILMWEKKTELAKESKALVASEEIMGEMQAMKWDIHRMQNRYVQLKRQQEVLMQETEKLVTRRETILTKNETQTKTGKRPLAKSSVQKAIEESRLKLKQSTKDTAAFEDEITQLETRKQANVSQKEQLEKTVQNLEDQLTGLEKTVRQTERHYQRNFQQLIALQQRGKFLQQVKEGKYKFLTKSEFAVKDEVAKSWSNGKLLQGIITKLAQNFPQHKHDLMDLGSRHEGRLAAIDEFSF